MVFDLCRPFGIHESVFRVYYLQPLVCFIYRGALSGMGLTVNLHCRLAFPTQRVDLLAVPLCPCRRGRACAGAPWTTLAPRRHPPSSSQGTGRYSGSWEPFDGDSACASPPRRRPRHCPRPRAGAGVCCGGVFPCAARVWPRRHPARACAHRRWDTPAHRSCPHPRGFEP